MPLFSQSPRPSYSDEELLAGYQRTGRLPWLGMLYERYTDMVYGVCLKYLQNETEAEDAVMAIFEELVEKARKHEIDSFRPWLYVLTKNHCLMFLRKQKRTITNSFDPHRMYSGDTAHPIAEEYIEDPNIERLEYCIEQLNEAQQKCIRQFYLDDKSYKDIAGEQNLPMGTVRSHIQNGRRNLRKCIEEKAAKEK